MNKFIKEDAHTNESYQQMLSISTKMDQLCPNSMIKQTKTLQFQNLARFRAEQNQNKTWDIQLLY